MESKEDPDQRREFELIRSSYQGVTEPEQQAMLNKLRFKLPTIPLGERTELVRDIEFEIGQRMIDFLR